MKNWLRSCLVASVGVLIVVTAPGEAWSQSTPRSSAEIDAEHERARQLHRDHRDEEALAIYAALYQSTHEARALARMGLTEASLGRWVDAEAHLGQALHMNDPWIAENLGAGDSGLRHALDVIRTHLGNLEVTANVQGAELWCMGQRVAVLPMMQPLRVPAGDVRIEVRAAMRLPETRVAHVLPGVTEVTSVTVALRAPPQAADTDRLSPAPRPVGVPETPTETRGPGAAPWVVVGVGAAALVTGAVFRFVVSQSAADQVSMLCGGDICAPEDLGSARAQASSGLRAATLGDVGLGVGGSAIVSGLLWYFLTPRVAALPRAVAVVQPLSQGGVMMHVGGVL